MTERKEQRERMRQERLAAQQAAASSDKRRLYLGYAVAGLIVAAIVAGIVVAISGGGGGGGGPGRDSAGDSFPELAFIEDELGAVPEGIELDGREGTAPPAPATAVLADAAKAAGCELMLDLPEEGNSHLDNEDVPNVKYNTNPPTSGDHYAGNEVGSGALAGGAYLEFPPVGRTLHALEHGRVTIQYSPDLSEAEQLELKGLFEESPEAVVLSPNPDMPYAVATTAWTQLAGCERYEGAATLDLLRAFRDTYRGLGPEPVPTAQ